MRMYVDEAVTRVVRAAEVAELVDNVLGAHELHCEARPRDVMV